MILIVVGGIALYVLWTGPLGDAVRRARAREKQFQARLRRMERDAREYARQEWEE